MPGKRKRVEAAGASSTGSSKTSSKNHHVKKKQKGANPKKVSQSTFQKTQTKVVKKTQVQTPVQPTAVANSNWLALKSKIQRQDHNKKGPQTTEKKRDLDVKAHKQRAKQEKQTKRQQARTAEWVDNSRIVGMDCEMVGVGLSGKTSVLARCSIVDYNGDVLYDKHVRPVEKVTDFRTHVSGIKAKTLRNAIPFAQCLKEVGKLMQDKIIVGHALKNDFQALMFTPPKHLIRDTAYYRPYMRRKKNGTKLYPKSLKQLTQEVLGKEIQTGQHDSVEDARATLDLYKKEQFAWEKYLRTNKGSSSLVGVAPPLPEKDDEDDSSKQTNQLSAAAKAQLDSDDEGFSSGRISMAIPDSKELAIMEYGE